MASSDTIKSLKKDKEDKDKSLLEKAKQYIKDSKRIIVISKRLLAFFITVVPKYAVLRIIFGIVIALFPFVSIWIDSQILDYLVNTIANKETVGLGIVTLIALAIGSRILDTVARRTQMLLEQNMWFKFGREIELSILNKFAYLDTEHHEDPELKDKLSKVASSYGRPQNFINQLFFLFEDIIGLVSSIVILFTYMPLLIILVFLTSIPDTIVNLVFGRRSWGIWNSKGESRRNYYNTASYIKDELKLMELRIFNARNFMMKRIRGLYNDFEQEKLKNENQRALYSTAATLLSIIGSSIAYVMIILGVLSFNLTIGQFNFYTQTLGRFSRSLSRILSRFTRLYENGLFIIDMYEVLDLQVKVPEGTKKLNDTGIPPKIEFRNVSFKYPNTDDFVIKNFNLTIQPKEHIAFVGENGAGKTTLIKLLLRFYDVTDGEIIVDGISLKEISMNDWYKKIGALFQEFNKYHFTAQENIGIGNIPQIKKKEKVVEAAQKTGAHEIISNLEYGYDQILSRHYEGGTQLSQGQWQKVSLSRAFFKNPEILILDEPTSAIDPKAEFEIFDNLFDFAQEKTVIIISHRFSTVRNADRIIVLDQGKIIEQGSHEKLLSIENGKYKHAFNIQKKGYE